MGKQMLKNTDTYIISGINMPATRQNSDGSLERTHTGDLVRYDISDVVNTVKILVKSKRVEKGLKIIPSDTDYLIYRFTCDEKLNNEIFRYIYRIKVSIEKQDELKSITDELDEIISNLFRTKFDIMLLKVKKVFNTILSKDMFEKKEDDFKEFLETLEYNNKLRENNLPPLGACYSDGTAFNGTYEEWKEYLLGIDEKITNETSSDEGTKIYEKK